MCFERPKTKPQNLPVHRSQNKHTALPTMFPKSGQKTMFFLAFSWKKHVFFCFITIKKYFFVTHFSVCTPLSDACSGKEAFLLAAPRVAAGSLSRAPALWAGRHASGLVGQGRPPGCASGLAWQAQEGWACGKNGPRAPRRWLH